jgi:hypothetical protein
LEEEIEDICSTYNDLISMGGRPTAPINHDPGFCDPSKSDKDKEYHLRDHWARQERRINEEHQRWMTFREYQERVRDPSLFEEYIQSVREFMCDARIEWCVQLHPEQQTKLDEWKEFFIHERRRYRHYEQKLKRTQDLPDSQRDRNSLRVTMSNLKQLRPVLTWIESQFPIIAAELAASSQDQATRQTRIRSKAKTMATGQQAIWKDRLRPRRSTVSTPPQNLKAAKPAGAKPQGIVKRSGRSPQKKTRKTSTPGRATRSSQRRMQ